MSRRSAAETRDAILDVARDLFEVGGYFSVGLEAVAKKAGVSRQAIYLHFDSKAALVEALHERVNRLDVEPVMRHVWEQTDANAALDSFVTASAQAIPKIIAIANALNHPGVSIPTSKPPGRFRFGAATATAVASPNGSSATASSRQGSLCATLPTSCRRWCRSIRTKPLSSSGVGLRGDGRDGSSSRCGSCSSRPDSRKPADADTDTMTRGTLAAAHPRSLPKDS